MYLLIVLCLALCVYIMLSLSNIKLHNLIDALLCFHAIIFSKLPFIEESRLE